MAALSVQISLDEKLLSEIDRRRKAARLGRSALIQRALRLYLETERSREIDRAYERAYGGKGDEVYDEFAELMQGQAWP